MVYKNLADASFLLDGLAGRPLTPNDVFLNTAYILDELELIAAKLRAPLSLDVPAVEGRKTPKDVAQQVLRASYKMVNLQTRLGMDASSVPNLTLVRVTPSEVYDATNMLLAEMTRIKHHLDINVPRQNRAEPTEQGADRRVRPGAAHHREPGQHVAVGRRVVGDGAGDKSREYSSHQRGACVAALAFGGTRCSARIRGLQGSREGNHKPTFGVRYRFESR